MVSHYTHITHRLGSTWLLDTPSWDQTHPREHAADEPLLSEEIIRRTEDDHGVAVGGSRGLAGILQGLTQKHSKEFRRSIMPGRRAGSQYEWRLTLDKEQENTLQQELAID